jgi:protein-tyrosine-phosphatase/predicted ATP-grasp superfamily ATP-dependent carboligase
LAILIGKSFPFWLTGTISFREEECSETVASTAANSMATLRTGRVLVLGCDSRSGLTVVRSLGRAGLAVDIGWPEAGSLAGTSRYVRAVRDIPAYDPADRSVEPAWKRSLIDLVEDQRYDLVIPCSDPAIIPLQLHADELARHGRFYTLSDRAFTTSFDKWETHRLAEALGIPTAPWVRVEKIGDIASVGSEWQLPLVLKPLSSFDMAGFDMTGPAGGKRMVRKLYDRARLAENVAEMLLRGPLLAQANFSGRGVGVEVVASDGNVLCAFQHERVHEPPHGGGSSYRRSVPLDPRLGDATCRLAQALDYTGVMQAEFRVDGATGRWILVEINGRFWGSLPLAVASGMDFPLGLYRVLVEGCRELPRTYRTGIHCRSLGLDIGWFFKNLRADRSDPTLQTRKLWQVAAEIRHVVTLTERSDLLVLDDPKPGLLEIRGLAVECGRRAAGALRWRFRRTRFARRRAARRLSVRASGAHSILFVCKGNICRSPFAAEYARRILPERIGVASAGYYPQPLRRCPGEAVAAAARFDIDLSNHRSAVLNGEMIASADLIFVFDDENFERVLLNFPESGDRIFYVGLLDEEREFAIPDPWGSDAATFGRCYTSIRAALDCLMPALRAGGDTRPPAATPSLYCAIGAEHPKNAHQE